MQKEENKAPLTEDQVRSVLVHVLDMMKHVVSDAGGIVPEEMRGAFETISADTEGNPYVQTIAGMVVTTKEGLANGHLFYSPNLGVDGESLCIELVNLFKYVATTGLELIVCAGHYVDPQGVVSYGAEARKVKRFVDQSQMLNAIKQMQEEANNKPKLVLPDTRIVTR